MSVGEHPFSEEGNKKMNLVVISSNDQNLSLDIISKKLILISPNNDWLVKVLKIDSQEKSHACVEDNINQQTNVSVVELSSWLNDNKVNHDSIYSASKSIPISNWILLDATFHSKQSIFKLLEVAKEVWYRMDQWHCGFAIKCNEIDTYDVARALSECFYLRPILEDGFVIDKKMRLFMMKAYLINLIGYKITSLAQFKKLLCRIFKIE